MALASRLGRALWALLLWSAVLGFAAQSALDASSADCASCHQERASAHLQDWEQSVHARSGIRCTSCHDANCDDVTAEARPDFGAMHVHRGVVVICERCHQDVGQAFRESPHYRSAATGAATPTCVDCHSAAGGSVLSGDLIPRRCATCHGASAAAAKPWVTEKAPDLLYLLRRVTLARTMVEERLDVVRRLGGDVTAFRADLGRVDGSFRDIPVEWHRFNLKDAESRTDILRAPQPTVSRHLAYLRRSGFVDTRQHGLWVFYELAPARSALHGKLLECLAVGTRLLPEAKTDRVRARRVRRSGGCCPEGRRLMEELRRRRSP
jgi:DNA-binding transcriptional ArsR family regulator